MRGAGAPTRGRRALELAGARRPTREARWLGWIEDPAAVARGWEWALGADRPCVLDIRTDPAVPPIPPHADWDQIKEAAAAVLHGDSDRGSMVRQGLRAKLAEVLPHRGGGRR